MFEEEGKKETDVVVEISKKIGDFRPVADAWVIL
jgi:hypothetical protein